jgi:putative ATPase
MKDNGISPLAERLRPETFEEIFGQPHLLGEMGFITHIIKTGRPLSIILWGPPGSGKTSIARLYAKAFDVPFKSMSAIFSGVSDLKQVVKDIEERPLLGRRVVLFVDEIHRFNKAQQDAFLPHIEKGTIILVGATAENPSFYLNNALLSRVRVLKVNALDSLALHELLLRYEKMISPLRLSSAAREYLIAQAHGDGRYLLNLIENVHTYPDEEEIDVDILQQILQKKSALYDQGADQHYNLISALHKSVRGSDPDAALYWFCRMLEGGEEPLFLARRLMRMATEDIGLADPQALGLAVAAAQTYQMLGSPEGELALAEVVIYLALAPKSNALYMAYNSARQSASDTNELDPPSIILNAPTPMMKHMGYGKGYQYDHDLEDAFSGQEYFPADMERKSFYHPVARGFEREMRKRMVYFQSRRRDMS